MPWANFYETLVAMSSSSLSLQLSISLHYLRPPPWVSTNHSSFYSWSIRVSINHSCLYSESILSIKFPPWVSTSHGSLYTGSSLSIKSLPGSLPITVPCILDQSGTLPITVPCILDQSYQWNPSQGPYQSHFLVFWISPINEIPPRVSTNHSSLNSGSVLSMKFLHGSSTN